MARLRVISASDGGTGDDQAIRAHVIEEMVSQAPILDALEFRSIMGNSTTESVDTIVTGAGEMRTAGNDYTPSAFTPSETTATLRILGDKFAVDQAWQRRYPGATLGSRFATEAGKVARSIARHMVNELINGDNVSPNVNGLKVQATGGQLLTAAANGLSVVLGSDNAAKIAQQTFLARLDELIAAVPGCQGLLMNRQQIARLKAIAREYLSVSNVQDVFGRNQEIISYNGLPIYDAGMAKDNTTQVLPNNEVVGSSGSVCSSVYAFASGEDSDLTVITSTGVSVKVLGLVGQAYTGNIEIDINTLLYSARAIARLQGVIIS